MPRPPANIEYALIEDLWLDEGSISPPDGSRMFYASARLEEEPDTTGRRVLAVYITGIRVELKQDSRKRPWLWQSANGRFVYRKPCREKIAVSGSGEIKTLEPYNA